MLKYSFFSIIPYIYKFSRMEKLSDPVSDVGFMFKLNNLEEL